MRRRRLEQGSFRSKSGSSPDRSVRQGGRDFEVQEEGEVSTPSLRTPAASSPSLVYECLLETRGSIDSVLAEGLGVDFACQAGLLPVKMLPDTCRDGNAGVIASRGGKRNGGSNEDSQWEEEQDSSCAHSGGGFRPVRAWHSAGGEMTQRGSQDVRNRGKPRRLFEGRKSRWDVQHEGKGELAGQGVHVLDPRHGTHVNTQGHDLGGQREVRFTGSNLGNEVPGGETGRETGVPAARLPSDDQEEEREKLEKQMRVRQSWEEYRKIEADWQEFLKKQASWKVVKPVEENDSRPFLVTDGKIQEHFTRYDRGRPDPKQGGIGGLPHMKEVHRQQQWLHEQQRWSEQVEAMEGKAWEGKMNNQQRMQCAKQEGLGQEERVRDEKYGDEEGRRRVHEHRFPSMSQFPDTRRENTIKERMVWTDPEENLFVRDARMQARERGEIWDRDIQGMNKQHGEAADVQGRYWKGMPQLEVPAGQEPWRERAPFTGRNVDERATGWNPTAEAEMYKRRGMMAPPELHREQGFNTGHRQSGERWEEADARWTQGEKHYVPAGVQPYEVIPPGVTGIREGGLSRMVAPGSSPQVWTWSSCSPGVGIVSALPSAQLNTGSRWDTKVVPIEWPRVAGGPPPMDRINMKLPTFAGGKHPTLPEDAEQWLNTLGAAVGNNMWTFDQAFKMIQSHLQGAAGTWYGSYGGYFRTHPEGRYAGWHAFWVEFEARFVVRDEAQLEAALQNRTQRTNEGIMDFADSLRVLASKLGISCDSRRVRMLFLNGLHNQQLRQGIMTHAVVRMTTETLRATVSMALEYEDFLATEKLNMKQMKQVGKESSPRLEVGKDSRQVKQAGESTEVETEVAAWKQAFHKQAKQIEELFKRQTGLSQTLAKATQQTATPARKPLSEIQCNNCREFGHFARNCPHPRKEFKPTAKSVRFLEEDLDQIRLTEEMDPGWYPLDSIYEGQDQPAEGEFGQEEVAEWDEVCTLGVGLAPTAEGARLHQCGQAVKAPAVRDRARDKTRTLDPRNTWIKVDAGGKIVSSYVADENEVLSVTGQKLAKMTPVQRQGENGSRRAERRSVPLASKPTSPSATTPGVGISAYDPAAPPLPGVVYQPCYTAYLPAKILGVDVNCLIDTGATISVLTVASVLKLKLQGAVQKTNKCFYTASAQCVPAFGELPQLPVEVDGICIPINFYIVPKGGYELLIGMDFLVPRCAVLDMGRATLSFAKKVIPGDDYTVMKKVNMDIRRSTASPLSYLRNCTVFETDDWRAFPPEEEWEDIVGAHNPIWRSGVVARQTHTEQNPIFLTTGHSPAEPTPSQLFDPVFQTAPTDFAVSNNPELPRTLAGQLLVGVETGRSRPYIAAMAEAEGAAEMAEAERAAEMAEAEGAAGNAEGGGLVPQNFLQNFLEYTPGWEEQCSKNEVPDLEEGERKQNLEEPVGGCVCERNNVPRLEEPANVPRLEEPAMVESIYVTCVSQVVGPDFLADRVWERVTGRNGLGGLVQGEYVASGSEFVESVDGDRGSGRVMEARDASCLAEGRGPGRLKDEGGTLWEMREDWQKGRRIWPEGWDDSVELEVSESEEDEELEISRGQAGELGAEALDASLAAVATRAAVQESLSSGKERQSAVKNVVSSWPESLDKGITTSTEKGEGKEEKKLFRHKSALEQIIDMSAKEWREECKRSGALPGKFRLPAMAQKMPKERERVRVRPAWKPTVSWAVRMSIKEWEVEYESEQALPGKFRFPNSMAETRRVPRMLEPTKDVPVKSLGEEEDVNSWMHRSATPEGEDKYLDSNCFTFCAVYAAKLEKNFPDNIQIGDHLTAAQRKEVRDLVLEFSEVFEEDPYQLTCSTMEPHVIETGEARPINIPPYRYSQKESDAIEVEVSKMLQLGIIEPSNSPWSASVVAVIKKDATLRICVDFRELNKVTKSDNYPIPLIEDMLDRLAGSDLFSSLDLRSAFWQVVMEDGSKEKTAFSTKTGHYQFKRMPFGLKNALPTFQRGVDLKFKKLQRSCQQYVDDLTAHGKGFSAGLNSLRGVLMVCREAILKVKAAKTMLVMQSIDYLGFVVTGEGVKPDPRRVEAILKLQVPTDVTGVRAAIGMYIQYKRYMPEFSKEAAVLNDLVKKGREWRWTEECDLAWLKLKKLLTSAPLLAHPNLQMTMVIQSDWSPRALGAVLSQRQFSKGGEVIREEVVAYYSKKLNDAEQNYSATEGECLAVVKAIANWHKYLFGRRFIVETDHLALRWLMQARNLDGRVARWSVKLMPYEFTIVYRRGSKHLAADAMSRLRHVKMQEWLTFCVTVECLREAPVEESLGTQLEELPNVDVEARVLEALQENRWVEEEYRSEPERWRAYMQKTTVWLEEADGREGLVALFDQLTEVRSHGLCHKADQNRRSIDMETREEKRQQTLEYKETTCSWSKRPEEWFGKPAWGRNGLELKRPPGLAQHVEEQMQRRQREEYEECMKAFGKQAGSGESQTAGRQQYLEYARKLMDGR